VYRACLRKLPWNDRPENFIHGQSACKNSFPRPDAFFHKLHALKEIIEELQKETRAIVEDVSYGALGTRDCTWRELEVSEYDLNTCMGETTVVLKFVLLRLARRGTGRHFGRSS